MDEIYEEYVAKYGQDNADYLMEVLGEWGQHYERAVYIEMGSGDGAAFEQLARDQAARRGWTFERMMGDRRMLRMLLYGDWAENEFLVVPPGYAIQQSGDETELIVARPADGSHD